MTHRNEWIIIGISGVTCGGKTTLANKLTEILTPVYVFHQDKYFYPDDSPKHIPCDGLAHNNYDVLSALDMHSMHEDIMATLKGDLKAHQSSIGRRPEQMEIKGKKFLIVEGFTVLNFKPIMELCDFRYYFILEYGECLSRRVYRLYDPPDIDGYFDTCVWPEHLRYRAEIEKDSRVVLLDGTRPDAFDVVLNDLRNAGATHV
ncbi:unnamed protein product [Diatraea saccharalis]|uniref:Phosphoribulokinase/uridine kinase domain-containing protein n=1 Tax=Diatraea saccharalis TaxID=40085 RepID=A0A9N9WGP7_9NEOP|nr:unnamed protein product [Diatraea saccharalis]